MTRIRIGFTFLLFIALMFMFSEEALILRFFSVCAVHEAGHLSAALLLGVRIQEIRFSGLGIAIVTEKNSAAPLKRDAAVLLAGPGMNMIMSAVVLFSGISNEFAMLNLAAAVYNLLPFYQLDGGTLLLLFITGHPKELQFRRIAGMIQAALIAVFLLMFLFSVRDNAGMEIFVIVKAKAAV